MSQGNKTYKCETCGLVFFTQEELEEHMRQHERAREIFKCNKCGETFKTQEDLQKHVIEHHQSK